MDERTFERLAQEYSRRLYAVAYRMLGHRADAEDAVQRALLKCFAARASYSPRWAVSTWLYRAVANVCIDELRRRKVRGENVSIDELRAEPRKVGQQLSPIANQISNGFEMIRSSIRGFSNKVLQRGPLHGLNRFLEKTYQALEKSIEPPVTFDDMDGASRLVDALLEPANRI